VITKVKVLLQVFNEESIKNSTMTDLPILHIMTSIIIEAMQYCDMIPPENETELKDVNLQLKLIMNMNDNLENLREKVAIN